MAPSKKAELLTAVHQSPSTTSASGEALARVLADKVPSRSSRVLSQICLNSIMNAGIAHARQRVALGPYAVLPPLHSTAGLASPGSFLGTEATLTPGAPCPTPLSAAASGADCAVAGLFSQQAAAILPEGRFDKFLKAELSGGGAPLTFLRVSYSVTLVSSSGPPGIPLPPINPMGMAFTEGFVACADHGGQIRSKIDFRLAWPQGYHVPGNWFKVSCLESHKLCQLWLQACGLVVDYV